MRLHIHWHNEVRRGSVWSYRECRCGHRIARRTGNPRPFAVDQGWLDGGEFRKPPTEPPPKPADAARSASPNAARRAAGLPPAPPCCQLAVQPAPPPPGVPLNETTAPVHYEGDTSSV